MLRNRERVFYNNKPVTALLFLIVSGGTGLVALMLLFGIRAIILYSNGPFLPQEPSDWLAIVPVLALPPLLFFFFKISFAEIMNLIRNFDSRVKVTEYSIVHVNNQERKEIPMKDIVKIISFRGKFGRFTHAIESRAGIKIKLDTWRYWGISEVIAEIKQERVA